MGFFDGAVAIGLPYLMILHWVVPAVHRVGCYVK